MVAELVSETVACNLSVCKQVMIGKALSVDAVGVARVCDGNRVFLGSCSPPVCEQVMISGLDDAPAAVPPDPAECFTAAEALLPGKVPQPKPGEPQVIGL